MIEFGTENVLDSAIANKVKNVVVLSTDKAAVHLVLLACGVGPGDEVIVQSRLSKIGWLRRGKNLRALDKSEADYSRNSCLFLVIQFDTQIYREIATHDLTPYLGKVFGIHHSGQIFISI